MNMRLRERHWSVMCANQQCCITITCGRYCGSYLTFYTSIVCQENVFPCMDNGIVMGVHTCTRQWHLWGVVVDIV